jgi:hypothetical protein
MWNGASGIGASTAARSPLPHDHTAYEQMREHMSEAN